MHTEQLHAMARAADGTGRQHPTLSLEESVFAVVRQTLGDFPFEGSNFNDALFTAVAEAYDFAESSDFRFLGFICHENEDVPVEANVAWFDSEPTTGFTPLQASNPNWGVFKVFVLPEGPEGRETFTCIARLEAEGFNADLVFTLS